MNLIFLNSEADLVCWETYKNPTSENFINASIVLDGFNSEQFWKEVEYLRKQRNVLFAKIKECFENQNKDETIKVFSAYEKEYLKLQRYEVAMAIIKCTFKKA